MSDDNFDEDPDLEEEADLDLEEEADLDDEEEANLDDEDADLEIGEVVVDPVVPTPRRKGKASKASDDSADEDEDEIVDLEEELHPDDVEEPLDVLLAERTAAERMDEEEAELEDEEAEPDDRGDGSGKIVPRRDDEFLCEFCFMVKPLSQRPDPKRNLCRDCV